MSLASAMHTMLNVYLLLIICICTHKQSALMLFVFDIQKAYGIVSESKLFNKIQHCDINGSAWKPFHFAFNDRFNVDTNQQCKFLETFNLVSHEDLV